MPSPQRLHQVSPDPVSNAGASTDDVAWWVYELRPAHALPTVDFSVSLRSRFLDQRWLARTTRCMRHGQLFLLSFVLGMGLLSAMFVTQDAIMAQLFAVLSGLLQLPSCLVGIGVLRFEMVRLMVQTYDFWFFFVCNLAFVSVICLQFGDARVFAAVAFCAGTTNNILIDGNLRGARRMVFINLGAVATMVFFLVGVKIDLIVSLRSFSIFRYGAYELPAQGFTVSCLLTLVMMVSRNIARARRDGRKQQVQCVSYRCLLRLVRYRADPPLQPNDCQMPLEEVVSPIQQLQCVHTIGLIDARKTVVPWLSNLVVRSRCARILVQMTGASAFFLSALAAILADYQLGSQPPSTPVVQLTATALTVVFALASGACLLRQVHKALISSFDFLYVSALLTMIHVTACDYYQWHTSPSLVVLTSWLWIHWAMCADALSPLVKNSFRLHVRFPAVVIAVAIAACAVLLFSMIVLDTSNLPYDRVIWSSVVFHKPVTFRATSVFFDSVASVLAWSLRLLYRAWRFDSDMMIVLDGPVAYTNYMSQARQVGRQRQRIVSRRWKLSSRSRRVLSFGTKSISKSKE